MIAKGEKVKNIKVKGKVKDSLDDDDYDLAEYSTALVGDDSSKDEDSDIKLNIAEKILSGKQSSDGNSAIEEEQTVGNSS